MSDTSLDERRDVAAVHPTEFWTEYTPQPDGSQTGADWVTWVKKGDAMLSTCSEKIDRLRRDRIIWAAIEPYYHAWKRGQAMPENGTPLDAAPFMSKKVVDALRPFHLFTVEDLANAEDSALSRTGIMGIRGMQTKARAYLKAQGDVSAVASELAARDATIAAQAEALEELRRTVDELAVKQGMRQRGRQDAMQATLEG